MFFFGLLFLSFLLGSGSRFGAPGWPLQWGEGRGCQYRPFWWRVQPATKSLQPASFCTYTGHRMMHTRTAYNSANQTATTTNQTATTATQKERTQRIGISVNKGFPLNVGDRIIIHDHNGMDGAVVHQLVVTWLNETPNGRVNASAEVKSKVTKQPYKVK